MRARENLLRVVVHTGQPPGGRGVWEGERDPGVWTYHFLARGRGVGGTERRRAVVDRLVEDDTAVSLCVLWRRGRWSVRTPVPTHHTAAACGRVNVIYR